MARAATLQLSQILNLKNVAEEDRCVDWVLVEWMIQLDQGMAQLDQAQSEFGTLLSLYIFVSFNTDTLIFSRQSQIQGI